MILSEAFGLGHTMVARAIKAQIEQDNPSAEIEIVEFTSFLRPVLSRMLSRAYLLAIQRSPSIWRYFYDKSRYTMVKPQLWMVVQSLVYGQMKALLASSAPDEIICTHPLPSALVSVLKRAGCTTVKLTTVVTDYGIHGTWISPEVDRYMLPSHHLAEQMSALGLSIHRLEVTGIPVHPKFRVRKNKAEARMHLGVTDLPTVVCMGGGLGLGLPAELGHALSKLLDAAEVGFQCQALFVTGKNNALFKELAESPISSHPHFHLYAFVEDVDVLMDASDLIVTKPGGVTCSETIAKGLPALLTKPLPGQEEDNLRYMVENGHGIYLKDVNNLVECATSLLKSGSFPHPPCA